MALRLGSSEKLHVFTNRVVFLLLLKLMQHGCLLQKPQNCAHLTRQVSHFANHTTQVSHFANKPIEYRNFQPYHSSEAYAFFLEFRILPTLPGKIVHTAHLKFNAWHLRA